MWRCEDGRERKTTTKHSDKEIIGLGNWAPVKGFEGLYEISRFGEVRGIKRQGTAGGRVGMRKIIKDIQL